MGHYLQEVIRGLFLVVTVGSVLAEPSRAQGNRVPAAGEEEAPSWRFSVTPNLWATAGGSDFTWQAWGGGGYDLGRCCTVVAAYRYLEVDHQDGLVYDVSFHGPALGLTLHF